MTTTAHADLIVAIIVCGFATWRISSLFVSEEGPWDMFVSIRRRCGITVPSAPTNPMLEIEYERPSGQLARLLSCVWCFSVWATPITWAVYYWIDPLPVYIVAGMVIPILLERALVVVRD